jgi:hypothetical protein
MIRSRKSKKDRQYNEQKIPKEMIRSHKSKKNRQYNEQKKKDNKLFTKP